MRLTANIRDRVLKDFIPAKKTGITLKDIKEFIYQQLLHTCTKEELEFLKTAPGRYIRTQSYVTVYYTNPAYKDRYNNSKSFYMKDVGGTKEDEVKVPSWFSPKGIIVTKEQFDYYSGETSTTELQLWKDRLSAFTTVEQAVKTYPELKNSFEKVLGVKFDV